MYKSGSSLSSGGGSSLNSPTQTDHKSITFTCNLDSIESISELVKKVYNIITPKCFSFRARIRSYGNKKQDHLAYFLTIPKPLMNIMFSDKEQHELDMKNEVDVNFYFDKNTLKKIDRNSGKEEILLLVKIVKNKHDSK